MLNTGRFVELEYELMEDQLWHLTRCEIDLKIVNDILPAVLEYPFLIQFPSSPLHLAGQLILALAKHRLDGGGIIEKSSYDRYSIAIAVKTRHERVGYGY